MLLVEEMFMNVQTDFEDSTQLLPHIPAPLLEWAHACQTDQPPWEEYDDIGLANGLTGKAFLPLILSEVFPAQDWLPQVHRYLSRIAKITQRRPLTHPGLYHGSSSIALIVSSLAQRDEQYQGANLLLWKQFCQHLLSWNWKDPFLHSQENFEVIGGAAGILRVLLTHIDNSFAQDAFERLLHYLLWVSETSERWYHRAEHLSQPARNRYPDGYLDLGMAHGLAGPLASLAIAASHGWALAGTHNAITRWASWLVEQHLDTEWGYDWPAVIPATLSAQECPPARTAWCYGTPGIARALLLAGRALADEQLCHIAYEALASALRRQKKCDEPQLCHGKAGLLLICLRFEQEASTEHAWLQEAIAQITAQLYDLWLRAPMTDQKPGFLTGATGSALALIAALTRRSAWWDKVLLLS